jgi:hypothetical protein
VTGENEPSERVEQVVIEELERVVSPREPRPIRTTQRLADLGMSSIDVLRVVSKIAVALGTTSDVSMSGVTTVGDLCRAFARTGSAVRAEEERLQASANRAARRLRAGG